MSSTEKPHKRKSKKRSRKAANDDDGGYGAAPVAWHCVLVYRSSVPKSRDQDDDEKPAAKARPTNLKSMQTHQRRYQQCMGNNNEPSSKRVSEHMSDLREEFGRRYEDLDRAIQNYEKVYHGRNQEAMPASIGATLTEPGKASRWFLDSYAQEPRANADL